MKDQKSTAVTSKQKEPVGQVVQQDYGLIGLVAVFIVLVGYNFYKGLPINDLLAIFWGYLGVSYLFRYRLEKRGLQLAVAIFGLIASISFLANYIITTW